MLYIIHSLKSWNHLDGCLRDKWWVLWWVYLNHGYLQVSRRSLSVRIFQPHFRPARWGNRRVNRDKTVGTQLAHMPTEHSKAHIFHILWLHLSLSLYLSLYVPIFVIKMLQLVIWCQTVASVLKQLTHASAQALNQLAWQGRLERCHGAFGSSSSGEKPL